MHQNLHFNWPLVKEIEFFFSSQNNVKLESLEFIV